jgi:ribosomal protein S12 methylthiotransferase
MTHKQKTVHFVSLGCAKNRVDTEVMAGIAVSAGAKIVADPEAADVIVVNTCAFIDKAREESVDVILDMARYAKQGKVLAAAGCMAQRYADSLAAEMPELQYIIGTNNLEALRAVIAGSKQRMHVGEAGHFLQRSDTPRFVEPGSHSAYIKIADGCSRKCAFCAIPAIRGTAKSRSINDIVAEATHLAASGIKELNLVAQDTSAFGRDRDDGADLPALLAALNNISSLRWIRLLYLYPDSVGDDLLFAMASLDKVVPYLDIPIQHASANMLKAMRRGHSPAALDNLLKRVRKILPNAYLRTTVLVGHPKETQSDFDALSAFVQKAEFHHLGVFRYSPEEGTASFDMQTPVSAKLSYNRFRKLMSLQKRIGKKRNQALLGTTVEVLVESPADDAGYVLAGRHRGQAPEVDGVTYLVSSSAAPGNIVQARVSQVGDYDIVAEEIEAC